MAVSLLWGALAASFACALAHALPPCVPMDTARSSLTIMSRSTRGALFADESKCCKLGILQSVCADTDDSGDGVVLDLSSSFDVSSAAGSEQDESRAIEMLLANRTLVSRILGAGGAGAAGMEGVESLSSMVPRKIELSSSKPTVDVGGWVVVGKKRVMGTFSLRQEAVGGARGIYDTAGAAGNAVRVGRDQAVQSVAAELRMYDYEGDDVRPCYGKQITAAHSPAPLTFDRASECVDLCSRSDNCSTFQLCAKSTGTRGQVYFGIVSGDTVHEFFVLTTASSPERDFFVTGFYCDENAISAPNLMGTVAIETNPATGGYTVIARSIMIDGGGASFGKIDKVIVANVT